MRFAIIAFVASCILAALAAVAPSNPRTPEHESMAADTAHPSQATIRRVSNPGP